MSRDPASIVALWVERKKRLGAAHAVGAVLRQVYNGEHAITLPELERNERTQVANLIQVGIDQHAQRIASVMPNLLCPPTKQTRQAQLNAENRRLAIQAWWYESRVPFKLRRRARHLVGYATSPILVRPGDNQCPEWETRDPLSTYPAPCDPDELVPPDCIFAFRRSLRWLQRRYNIAGLSTGRNPTPDAMFDVLQYIDENELVLLAVGKDSDPGYGQQVTASHIELSRVPNRAGRPLVVIPGRITLDRLQGQFDQLIGMYEAQGTLWALHMHAIKRAIFPEEWLVGRPNEQPNVITVADPYQGEVGVVEGGILTDLRTDPGVQTLPAMDRLERAERLTGAIPAEFGGESPSNVRTDKRGLSVMSSTIDFTIQEAQELFAASLEEENKIAIAISKNYWGSTSKTMPVPFGRGSVTYTPSTTFDTDIHRVSYAYAGADINNLVIAVGQRIGMGTLSKESGMVIDPLITDPDAEHDRIVKEAVEAAFLNGIQQQAAQPDGPLQPQDLARLVELVYEGKLELFEAYQKVHEEAQARQAQAVQGQLSDQQMQPGMAQAGAPGTPQAAIGPPTASSDNLVSILNDLRRPQRQVASEKGAPPFAAQMQGA